MKLKLEEIRTFTAKKDEQAENEDYAAWSENTPGGKVLRTKVSPDKTPRGKVLRAAVCDGATDSAFSWIWSRILAEGFVDKEPGDSLESWLEELRTKWETDRPKDIPWHGEKKVKSGALSTLIGIKALEQEPKKDKLRLEITAVGDSNLFHIKKGQSPSETFSYPIEKPEDFDTFPDLIRSVSKENLSIDEKIKRETIECREGDLVILASDAISCWLLQQSRENKAPWEELMRLPNQETEPSPEAEPDPPATEPGNPKEENKYWIEGVREWWNKQGKDQGQIKEVILKGVLFIPVVVAFYILAPFDLIKYLFNELKERITNRPEKKPNPTSNQPQKPEPEKNEPEATKETWEEWLAVRRREQGMKLDDTTILIFEVVKDS